MSDPWFKFFPSDWLGGTSGMTAAERGVYITLVAMIYDAAAPIRRDDARLARRCGITKASWLKIIETLIDDGKITVTADGGLTNDRCEIELSARGNRVENATVASAKAAQARSKKSEQYQREDLPPGDVSVTGGTPKPEARSQIYADADDSADGFFSQVCRAAGRPLGTASPSGSAYMPNAATVELVGKWKSDLDLTEGEILSEVARQARARRDGPPSSLNYFTDGLRQLSRELKDQRSAPLTPIDGGPHAQRQPAHDRRAAAADDAFAERVSFAARNRSPTRSDFGFG